MKVSFECRITYRRNPLFKRLGAVFAVLVMCTSLLCGADFYFNETGYWENSSNWSDSAGIPLNRVPGSSDTVHIVSSAECTLSSDVTVAALDVVGILKLSGATLTVSGEVTADGSSSLVVDNGKLNFTGDGAVVIPSAVFKNNVSLFGKNLTFSDITYDSSPDVTIGNDSDWAIGTVTIPGGSLGTLTLEPNSIVFKPTGPLTAEFFFAETSMKTMDLNGQDLTVNGNYTNNIEISNAGDLTVNGNFINNNAFGSSGTILITGNLSNDGQSYEPLTGTSVIVQGSILSNSGKIISSGAVDVTRNVSTAGEISGGTVSVSGDLTQAAGQITGTTSVSVTGTSSVSGTVSAPVIFSGDMTVEESGTLSGFNTLDVAGDMHTAGTFNYNSGAQVTVTGGFYNTGSIDSWSTLYLKANGFENTGTVKRLGNESTITVSRYFGDHSSSESVYPKLVLDPGEQITLAAGSARVENVTTTSGADEKLVTVFSGNFGTFIYDGINGGTFEVVEDTEGWFSNTGSPHFDNLQVTNASNGVFNITATPEIDNLVLSGKDTEHLLTVKGNGTISTSVTGISTGSNLSFDTTTPNLESGQILVSGSNGSVPEGWFDATTTFVWTGNSYVSGAWDIAENWYGSNRPNRNDGTGIIIINKGRFAPETLPYFGFDSISLKSLVINEGVIFDVGPNNLTLQGNLENEGTFKTSGNLYFDGNTDHSIKNSISLEGFLEVKAGSTLTVGSGVDISVGGFRNAGYVSHSGTLNVSGNFSDSGYAGEPKSSYEKIVLKGTGSFSVTTESILNTIEIAESAVVTTASDILTNRFMNSGSFSSAGTLTTTGDFINNGYVSHSGTLNVSGNFSDSGYAGETKSSYAEVVIKKTSAVVSGSGAKGNAASVSKLTVLRSNGVASAEFRNCLNVSDFDIKGTSDSELIEVSGNGIFYVPDSFDKVAANYVKFSEGLGVYKKSADVNSFEGLYVIAKNAAGELPSGWLNGDRSFIWTGGTDSIWTKPPNWAGENVPAGDTAEVIVKESSHNPEITSNVLLSKITLEGNAELNVASESLTLYSDTVLDGRIKASNGTIYITNKENDSTKVISLTLSNEQNIKDLFIAGFVNCEVTSETSGIGTLHIQDEKNIQKIDFKVSFSGEKLLVAYADITRSSVIDDVRGTLEIKNEIEIATEFKTHSGSIVSIPSGGKLITPSFVHSASNAKPETYVSVAGELSADSINLVRNNNESGSQLQVSENGIVNTQKIKILNSYKNGSLTVPVLNEGIINITGTITDDGLETPGYDGNGKIVLKGAGQIKNNSSVENQNITIAALELKDNPGATIDSGSGNITITLLSVNDVTEGTSSLSVKGVSSSSTIGIAGFIGKLKDFTLDSGTARLDSSLVIAGDFLTKVSTTVSGSGGVTAGEAFENNGTYNGTGHISCSGKFTNNGTINSGFALSAGGDFVDAGTWNAPGTITFNGTSDQNVKFKNGTTYSAVLSQSVNTAVVLATDLNCSSLTIKENSTFDSNGKNIVLSEELDISGTFLGKGGTHEIGSDVNIKGTVNGGSSTISLGGNWTLESSATFEAETGTVQFTGTEAHSVKGENTFNNFVCETAGALLLFEDGKTQTVTGVMKIEGTSGTGKSVTLDVIPGGSSGQWILDAEPSKLDFDYVNIKNSYSIKNIPGSKNLKRDYHCENGGNNTRWFPETKVYWFGSTGADKTNWNQKLNWKADEEGANDVLAVPDYSDSELEVYIVKTENSYPVLEAPVNIKKLSINNDAEFHMNGNNLVAVDFENKGIFNLSGGKLSVEGTEASYSNEGKMISQGSETISVPESSTNENGTWEYTGGSLKNIVNLSFRNILISEDVLLGTSIDVTESFEIAEGKTLTLGAFNLNTGSISNKGAVLINGAGRPDKNDLEKGLVKYSGSQTIKDFGGNDYFNLEISDSVVLESSISIAGKLTLDDGAILNTGNNNLSFVSYSGENEKIIINGGKISSSSETPLSVNEIEISSSAELDINAVISSVICKSNPEIIVSSGKNVSLPGISAGDLIVNGILSLSGDSSFESVLISSEGKLEGPSNGVISIAGNWKDQNVSGGFVHNSGEVQITEDSVIEGKSAFYNLYGRNLGGKTISIADGSEISVSNEVYFSGSSGTSLLTLSGTGKIKVPENYALESGKFINFSGDGPALAGDTTGLSHSVFAVAMESRSVSEFPSGWINGDITYVWLGRKNSDWNETSEYNWAGNNKPVNGENKIIRIIPEGENYPVISEDVSVNKVSLEKNNVSISTSLNKLSLAEYSAENECRLIINGGELEYTGLFDFEFLSKVEISSAGKISSGKKLTLKNLEYKLNPDITISGKVSLPGGNIGKLTNEINSSVEFDSAIIVTGAAENNGNILLKDQGSFTSLINTGTLNLGTSAEFSGDVTNNGTINAGTGNLTFGGKYSATSGTLTGCTSADPEICFSGDVTFGTFTHNNDPVFFAGSSVKTNGQEFKDCSFNGSGTVSVEGMLKISGNLSIETGKSVSVSHDIHLTGNFTNKGIFEASDGTFYVDGNSEIHISGNNTFNNFACETEGAVLLFEDGKTQTVTGVMKIKGTSGTGKSVTLDVIPGGSSGQWNLDADPSGFYFDYVKIKNSNSSKNIPEIKKLNRDYHCENGGNNTRWFPETKVYWFGSSGENKTNWNQKLNWKADEEGLNEVLAVPDYSDSELEVYIVKTEKSHPVLEAPVNIKMLSVSNGAEFDMNGKALDAAGFENRGSFRLSGGKFSVTGTDSSYFNEGKMISQGTEEISVPEGNTTEKGTWEYSGGTLKTVSSLDFNKVSVSGDVSLGSNIDVAEAFEIAEEKTLTLGAFNLNAGSISNSGTIFINGEGRPDKNDSEKGLVKYSGNQTVKDFGEEDYYNLEVSDTVTLENSVSVAGSLTLNNGTVLNAGSNNISFGAYSGENEKIIIDGGKISSVSETSVSINEIEISSSIEFDVNVSVTNVICHSEPELTVASGKEVILPGISAGDLTVNGNLSLGGDSSFASVLISSEGKLEGPSEGIISVAGNWQNLNGADGFVHNSGTVQITGAESHFIAGENTFNNFTCVDAGKTILFSANTKQTVHGKMKIIGEENSLIVLDVLKKSDSEEDEMNRWILDINPIDLDFKFVKIANSESLQNIPFASPSINLKNDFYCIDGGNTERWFADYTIYWYGRTDANWGTKSNWATSEDGTGILGSVPRVNDMSLNIVVVKDENDEGAHTLVLSSNIVSESFVIKEGKSVDLAGYSIKANEITNNGNLILSGEAEPVLIKNNEDSVINHSADSFIIFRDWISNVPVKTTSGGLGFDGGFENLKIEGSRNFVFADAEPDVVINGKFISQAAKNKAAGNICLKSDYVLPANNEFIAGDNSVVIFEGTVDSSIDNEYALKVTGNAEFKKEIGSKKKLSSLFVSGETKNYKKEIRTSGQQIYSDKLNLLSDITFECSSVVFGSDVLLSENSELKEITIDGNTIIRGNDPEKPVKIRASKVFSKGDLSGTALELEGDFFVPENSVSNVSSEIQVSGSFINEGKCIVSNEDSSGEISIYGNFENYGEFTAVSGTILLKGNEVNVLGDNIFYTLKIEEPGQKVYFQQGKKQQVNGALIIKGAQENPVILGSTNAGNIWEIDFNTRSSNTVVLYTEIKDSYYSGTNGNATALYSKDSGNNRAWDFPGQHYAWTGNKDTDWDNKENWTPDSIPGKGASVVIPDNCSNYPVLTAALNLVYSDLNNGIVIKGEIENNGELDFSGYSLKVGSFINNHTLKLLGTESFDETATVSSGDTSVIEYYGSAASTSPWVRKASAYKKLVVADNGVLTVNSALNANEIVNYGTLNVQSGNARILDELENSGSINISSGRTVEFARYTGSGEEKESVTINGGTLKYTGNESSILSSLFTNISAVISGPVGEGKKLVIKKSELNVSDLTLSGNIELPSGKAKTVIVSGGELSLSGDSFELQSLTINSDGKFISTSGTLTVNGNWENNDASGFTAKNGTVIFNGETISLKEAGQFNKIETSTGTLILYSDLNVSESLAVNSNLAVTNGSYSCFLGKVYSVDSPNDLNFSGTGDLYFDKSVLNMADISIPGKVVLKENLECNKFDVSGPVEIEGGEEISDRVISASVSQNYNSDITVTGSCTFVSPQVAIRNVSSDGNLRFDSKVLMKNPSTKIEATKTIFEGELAANTSGNKCSLTITGDVEFNKIVDVNGLEVLGNAVLNADIKASGNQKLSGTVEIGNSITLSGKKVFLDGDITKYNSDLNADEKYSLAVQASSSTLETPDVVFGGSVNGIENFTVTGVLKIEGNEINTSGNQTYNNDVIFDKDLRLTAEEKNIVFKKSLSGSKNLLVEAKEISFGASSNFKNLTLNSELAVANKIEITATENITLNGVSRLADTSFNCKNLSVNENINSGKLNVTVSDLFELSEGKDITLTGSFTQFGSGKNILSGSLISKNADVHFNSDVYLKGSSNLIFGTASTSDITKNYTFMGNLVIAMNSPETEINLNAPVTVKNLVLYRGALKNVNKITSENDIVLLGVDYSTDDGESGHEGEFKYNKTRKAPYNYNGFDNGTIDCFPDSEKTALPLAGFYGGSVEYNSGAVIKVGRNFYANGVSLSGQGTWYLDILKNADPKICFAEAYNCNISNGVVRNASSKTEQPDLSSVMAEACIFNGENRNWDSEDFEIVRAYTVTDNVICVELSSGIRNLYGEFDSNIQNIYFNNNGTKESFRRILSSYELNPGQTGRADYVELTKESKLELRKFYLQTQNDSDSRWNTDATGLSSGNSVSTDSHGVSQSAVPSIFFERKLSGTDGNFTNRFGKILKVSGSYYTGTEDQTGPVLVEVAVGQETHTDYDPEKGAESQPSYDAHNFIEFRYSEPICLNQSGNNSEINVLPFTEEGEINFFENLKVTETFGKISSQGFTVAGLAAIQKGQLITGKVQENAGVIDSTVHAFYRKPGMDPHSFRLSIAGYTEDVVKDNYEKEYKKWIGYIDSATVPQDKVTLPENGCSVIKDVAGNTFQSLKWEGLSVVNKSAYSELKDYGTWDISKPVFAVYRNAGIKWQNPEISGDYEAVGSTVDGTSSLKRIEFHMFDNKPLYNTSEAQWVSKKGWVRPFVPGPSADPDLYSADSYAADSVGGSRGFAAEERTTGGIRFCTIADASSAFKYAEVKPGETKIPDLDFSSDIRAYYGAASPIFQPGTNPARSPDKPDGLYFGYKLPSSVLSLKTQFAVSYDDQTGFVTDLAGNRLKSALIKTRDLTPPSFNMTVAPIGQKKIYIMFSKNLNVNTVTLNKQNGTPDNQSALNKALPEAFILATVESEGFTPSTGNQIDINVPARVLYSNESYMGLELTTTQDITYEDINKLYIVAKPLEGDYKDPIMDLKTLYATFIQDDAQNYMSARSAHILSDFAVNLIEPSYAYNEDLKSGDSNIQNGIFGDDSFAVHDWNAEQKNFGTLLQGGEIHIVSDVNDESLRSSENLYVRGYFDDSPDLKSVSEEYNKASGSKLRVWLPEVEGFRNFTALANKGNSEYKISDSKQIEDSDSFEFVIPETVAGKWKSGNQISFMFGLTDAAGNLLTRIHSPEYDYGIEKYVMPEPMPLFALRLKNPSDLTSLDLWSFRLKNTFLQKGNVSIFNNVIDSVKGEKTVLHIDNPSQGRVDVIVMTLDGNVVDYLNRGNLPQGVTELTWDGKNKNGKSVARGMYFIRIIGNGFDETRKVMVIKN